MSEALVIYEPLILVRINQLYEPGMSSEALFEATRGVWKVGPRREAARHALAVFEGNVVETYVIEGWQPAGTARYSTRSPKDVQVPGRWEFRGGLADESARRRFNGRSVKSYLPAGSRNPIVYVGC
jgi:hypothetical protein